METVETEEEIRKSGPPRTQSQKNLAALSLGAIGVVFGDIGTSPLYAMRQCFTGLGSGSVDAAAVLGILSLIFWALILMVCVKYATFILRADHDGEGGTLAMLALVITKRPHRNTRSPGWLVLVVLAGSALLYGDGVITPAISVLSAVEGLKVAAPDLQRFVVPLAVIILVGLFFLQSNGTERVGNLFGPVMTIWFLSIAILGVNEIIRAPRVLQAINPTVAIGFLAHHGTMGVMVLGGVVLCLTGAEALFADLSHFGRLPIRLAWYGLVLPALLLNYFGEGAAMLLHPENTHEPFFALVPAPLVWPMVILATLATIIASQALISGTFTLTEQAIHMGYFPRFRITHTSKDQRGQVYVAVVNYALMLACVGVVLGFRSSDKLGGAYGLAVIGTMMVTSLTFYFVLRNVWKWSKLRALLLTTFFLLMDASFLAGNVVKIVSGAWLPLVFAGIVFAIFWIWTEYGCRFRRALDSWGMPLDEFRRNMKKWTNRQGGAGIFLTTRRDFVPLVGRNHWLRDVARHEQIVIVTIIEESVPYVREDGKEHLDDLGEGLWRLTVSFGFMQPPNISRALKGICARKLELDWKKLVVYLPEVVTESKGNWWNRTIARIYRFLRHNSTSAANYFEIPPLNIVLVGIQLGL